MRIGDAARWRMKLDYARRYRKRIESEREDWTRLVHETRGNITKVSIAMGCYHSSACQILWDLGLWPVVQSYRLSDRKRTDMSLRSLVVECQGKVFRIAKVRGKSFQSTKQLLIRHGLWSLVEELRGGSEEV